MAHLFNKGIYYIENGTDPNVLGLVPTETAGLAKTKDGSLTWRYDDALPTNKWVLDNLDRYNTHIVATTAYDPLNPLTGWTSPSNPIQGNTVEVKFTDGTVANYTFDGSVWVLDFSNYQTEIDAIYILGTGQSNMQNRGIVNNYPQNVQTWDGSNWVYAAPSLSSIVSDFAEILALKTNSLIRYVNVSLASTPIEQWYSGANMYNLIVSQSVSVPKYDYVLWAQGEANSLDTKTIYGNKFDQVISDLSINSFWDNPEILVKGLDDNYRESGPELFLRSLNVENKHNAKYIFTRDLGDGVHINGVEVPLTAQRFYNSLNKSETSTMDGRDHLWVDSNTNIWKGYDSTHNKVTFGFGRNLSSFPTKPINTLEVDGSFNIRFGNPGLTTYSNTDSIFLSNVNTIPNLLNANGSSSIYICRSQVPGYNVGSLLLASNITNSNSNIIGFTGGNILPQFVIGNNKLRFGSGEANAGNIKDQDFETSLGIAEFFGADTKSGVYIRNYSNNLIPDVIGIKSRGTYSSPLAVQSGDYLMRFGGRGYNGTSFTTAITAGIGFRATATFTTTSNPTEVVFSTSDTSIPSSLIERAKIGDEGGFSVGAAFDPFTPSTGVINASVGFRVYNQAPVGAILVGNGTNYVTATNSTLPLLTVRRLTTSERDLLIGLIGGEIIYNVTVNKHQGFDGTIWNDMY